MNDDRVSQSALQIDLDATGIRRVVGPLEGHGIHPTVLTWWHRKFRETADTKLVETLVNELRAVTVARLDVNYVEISAPRWAVDAIVNEARRRARERVAPRTERA